MIQCCERRYFSFFRLVHLSLLLSLLLSFLLCLRLHSFFAFPLVDLWYPLTLAPCRAISYTIGPDASLTDRNRDLMMCGHFSTIAHGVVETSLRNV